MGPVWALDTLFTVERTVAGPSIVDDFTSPTGAFIRGGQGFLGMVEDLGAGSFACPEIMGSGEMKRTQPALDSATVLVCWFPLETVCVPLRSCGVFGAFCCLFGLQRPLSSVTV